MRRLLAALIILSSALAAGAQITPIPWHPKISPPAKKATPKKGGAKKREEKPRFHMTFDKITTLEPGVFLAEGDVRFESEGMLLTADSVSYDSNKGTLWATGQVAVDWHDFTAAGSELHYNMNTGLGSLRDAYGVQKDGDFTVFGKEIDKTGENWYTLIDGTMTSCTAAVPPWSMRVERGRFHIDHYAFLTNPRFKVRTVPILYTPYLIWPIKPDRSTGLLIPEIGNSTSKGFTVNNALFIAPADWWDDTIYLDGYSTMGWGLGEEFRYVPSTATYGWFHGYYIKQRTDDRKRWDFSWTHIQNFRKGWYFVADVNLLSDINFWRDYNRDYARGTTSGTDSRIYLARNWGPYSFSATAERRLQYFTDNRDLQQRTLPGFEFRSNLQPLIGALYGGFETSAGYFHKEWADYSSSEPRRFSLSYSRVDLHPYVELPWHPTLWLDVTPRLELRATGYGKSLDPSTSAYDAGSLWRNYARGSLEVVGPRWYRRYGGGLKHVIEPFLTYSYTSPDSKASRIPVFDQVDQVSLDWNIVRYGVRNRVYRKGGDLFLDSQLYQDSSFNKDLSALGERHSRRSPVTFLMRVWPTVNWSADFRLRYSILTDDLDSQSFSLAYKPKGKDSDDFVRVTYIKTKALGVSRTADDIDNPLTLTTNTTASQVVRMAGNLTLADGRLTLNPYLERDLHERSWRDRRLIFWYHGSCYSVGFEAGKRTIGPFTDSQYRFLISLKGAGTVVDLYGGTGTY